MRDRLDGSLPQIGDAINRDHSTILHGLKRADELIETNKVFAALYRQAENNWGELNAH